MGLSSVSNSILLRVALAVLCTAYIHAAESFDPAGDAEILRQALRRRDNEAIIQFVSCLSSDQRSQIAAAYGTRKSLVSDIQVALSNDFEDLVMALMTPLQEFYAKTLDEEASTINCLENILLDIMTTSSNDELKAFKRGNPQLLRRLTANCQGAANATIHDLFNGARNESQPVDAVAAKADAQLLYRIFEDENRPPRLWRADQFEIQNIFVTRSYRQLRKIFKMYKKRDVAGHSIETAIGNYKFIFPEFRNAVWSIYHASRSVQYYFADRLHNAMRPLGTDDEALNRIFVGRTGVDLKYIEKAYNIRHPRISLTAMIKRDTSGDYEDLLLAMLECNRRM